MPRLDDVTVPPGVRSGLIAGRVTRPVRDGVLMAVLGPAHGQQQTPILVPDLEDGAAATGSAVWAEQDDRGRLVAVAGSWGTGPLASVVPHARLGRTTTTDCPSGVPTIIPWEQAVYDLGTTAPQWSASQATSWVCRRGGLYRFTATLPLALVGGVTGRRRVLGVSCLREGGGIEVLTQVEVEAGSGAVTLNGSIDHRCQVGDAVLVFGYQDSGVLATVDASLVRFTASFASA